MCMDQCLGLTIMVLPVNYIEFVKSVLWQKQTSLSNSRHVISNLLPRHLQRLAMSSYMLPRKRARERHLSTCKQYTCQPPRQTCVDILIIHVYTSPSYTCLYLWWKTLKRHRATNATLQRWRSEFRHKFVTYMFWWCYLHVLWQKWIISEVNFFL
jgi:hypothetical protein